MAARTEIAQYLARNNSTNATTPTAIDATNGMIITQATATGTDVNGKRLLLRVKNSGAAAAALTVKGTTMALQRDVSDLVVSVDAGTEVFIGPLDRRQFLQSDYTYLVDPEAGMTGTIDAIWMH